MSDQDDTQTQDTDVDASTDRADDTEGQDQLGDAGKKALDDMKGKWHTERDARKERDARIAQLEAELAAGKKTSDSKGDEKPDVDEIRKQARAEADAAVVKDRALDRVEAKAAKLFADPEDARALLAGQVDKFVDNGKVDNDAIEEALDDLLKKKPHLAATANRFNGSADGGARKGSGKPAQLTAQDLKRMSPDEIVKAQADGRFADLMGT